MVQIHNNKSNRHTVKNTKQIIKSKCIFRSNCFLRIIPDSLTEHKSADFINSRYPQITEKSINNKKIFTTHKGKDALPIKTECQILLVTDKIKKKANKHIRLF